METCTEMRGRPDEGPYLKLPTQVWNISPQKRIMIFQLSWLSHCVCTIIWASMRCIWLSDTVYKTINVHQGRIIQRDKHTWRTMTLQSSTDRIDRAGDMHDHRTRTTPQNVVGSYVTRRPKHKPIHTGRRRSTSSQFCHLGSRTEPLKCIALGWAVCNIKSIGGLINHYRNLLGTCIKGSGTRSRL